MSGAYLQVERRIEHPRARERRLVRQEPDPVGSPKGLVPDGRAERRDHPVRVAHAHRHVLPGVELDPLAVALDRDAMLRRGRKEIHRARPRLRCARGLREDWDHPDLLLAGGSDRAVGQEPALRELQRGASAHCPGALELEQREAHLARPLPHHLLDRLAARLLPRAPQVLGGGVAIGELRHVSPEPGSEVPLAQHRMYHPDDRAALAVRDGVEDLLHLLCVRNRHLCDSGGSGNDVWSWPGGEPCLCGQTSRNVWAP
eukprot:scaffold27285_cov107-Isochrysis_galbana.AAC.6